MKQISTLYKGFTAAASAAVLSFSLSIHAAPTFTDMYIFGDSLSDTGNVADKLGVFRNGLKNTIGFGSNNRFSNGIVWHEYLSYRLGMSPEYNSRRGGNNYAYGGARVNSGGWFKDLLVDTYSEQVSGYLNNNSVDTDALYISWIGGNDVRSLVGKENGYYHINRALDGVANMLDRLLGRGVDHLLVPNLPDLGTIPEFASNDHESAHATYLTNIWNHGLARRLDSLTSRYTSASIYEFDVYGLFRDMMSSPWNYGLNNVTAQCRTTKRKWLVLHEYECANSASTLFWDEIHPTTAGHTILSMYAFDLIDNFTLPGDGGSGGGSGGGEPVVVVSAPPVGLLMLLALGLFIHQRKRA